MFHQPKLAITYLTGSLHSTPSWWFKLDKWIPWVWLIFPTDLGSSHLADPFFLFPMKSFTKTWKNSACCTPIFTRLLCIYLCREWSCLQAAKVNRVPEASKELSFEGRSQKWTNKHLKWLTYTNINSYKWKWNNDDVWFFWKKSKDTNQQINKLYQLPTGERRIRDDTFR